MPNYLHAARLALPLAFFGYAAAANLSLLAGGLVAPAPAGDALLSGGLTHGLDAAYKQDLPHMAASVGLIGAARYALLGAARPGALAGQDGWLFTAEEARARPAAATLGQLADKVGAIDAQLRADGARLVVVALPAKIDIHRAHSPDLALGRAMAALYRDFSAALAARGVAVAPARTALMGTADPAFFATDTHWTPEGAARVATAVAQSGAIAPGALVFARMAGAPGALTGDLVSYVTTPGLAPRVGLPSERLTRITQTQIDAPAGIFASDARDVVLVGTSYSANPDWGFADALMAALGRDVVSVAQAGLGPWQPMQDYLVGAEYRAAPPAVVIWEIPVRYLTDPSLMPAGSPAPDMAGTPLPPAQRAGRSDG